MSLSKLKKIANNTNKLLVEHQTNPLRFFSPTEVQEQVLKDSSRLVLLRGGNQIGKTFCGSYETICHVLGYSPFKSVPPAPIEAWVICHSWEQSRTIMAKFHDLVPKNELHPSVEFSPAKGYRGTGAPVVQFKNGSIVRFKTTNQGTLGVASGTVDFIWIDEPPPPALFGELRARITRRPNGRMLFTMTPIGAPVDYLKEMVKNGIISEHVGVMNVENTTPKGVKRPMMSEEEIEELSRSYLGIDRAARMAGDWDVGIPEGRIFEKFTDDLISDLTPDPNRKYVWSIGIDHGHDVASQVAVLCAVDITDSKRPAVYVVDEYVASGDSAENHAKGIIAMIKRAGLELAHIQRWTGDRSHGGSKNNGGRMSNTMLMAAFAHVLGYPKGKLPFHIRTAYKPKYSVYYGCQSLHELMCDSRFQIFPRAQRIIKSLKYWSMKSNGGMDTLSEWKHAIDALRYATIEIISVQYQSPKQAKLKLRG
jgi:phage terminase large subunit-like protein